MTENSENRKQEIGNVGMISCDTLPMDLAGLARLLP